MIDLGKIRPGSTVRIPFGSFAAATGAPTAVTNYADADIQVYKDGDTTQRASAAGLTATTTFDTLTGINLVTISTADDTTAGFWSGGSEYIVVISDITVDGQTLRFPIARFVIGIEGEIFATTIATLASQTSFTLTAGSADNSAYVGSVVYIHKFNSAIQSCMGTISAYTGASKTVTLAVDPGIYTITVKDAISIMPRANVYSWNGTAVAAPATAGIPDVNVKNINNVAAATPGAANGILISGSNSGTTTLGALTVTGAQTNGSTVFGNTTMGTLTQTGAASWGATTIASEAITGALSVGTTTTLTGAVSLGSTLGITGVTTHTGNVVLSDGLTISAPSTLNRAGLTVTGNGTGAAFALAAGATGKGIAITTTAGDGLSILPTAGDAIVATGNGTSKHGMRITGGTAGTSDGASFIAGTGGVDIRGNQTGNLVGTVSTLTTYTGNTVQTGDSFARIGAAGAGLTAIDLPNQTMDITGNITGNLSGSVGSVTGAVGSVTGAVGSVTGAVGSVTGAVGSVTGAVGSVTGLTAATVHADLDDIQARLPAALTANGNMKSSLVEILTTALTETVGQLAGGFKKFFNVAAPASTMDVLARVTLTDTVTTYTGNTPQTGDVFPLVNTEVAEIYAAVITNAAGVDIAADIIAIKADTAAILVDTGTTLDAAIADLPTNAELATALGTADDAVLAQVALVKAKTDQLVFTKANEIDANVQSINGVTIVGDGSITPFAV